MKRSKLGVAITAFFITFLAVGCSNTSSNNSSNSGSDKYTTYMNQGKDAASSQQYEAAEEKFEDAHDVKATSESKTYADQAGNMKDAKEKIREYEFKDALGELDKVANKTNGYSVMTKQAAKLYKTINKVQDHIKNDINPLYKQAKISYRDGNYQSTIDSCDQILDLPYINSKYYKKVKKNVKHLRKVANARLNGEDVNEDIDTDNLDANDEDEATSSNKQASSNSNSSTNLTLQVLTAITVLTKLIQVILILKTIVLQINNHLIQMLQAVINLLIITIPAVTPHLIQITIA